LEGMNGFSRFNIHRDYGSKDRLPSSHTCFNRKFLNSTLLRVFTNKKQNSTFPSTRAMKHSASRCSQPLQPEVSTSVSHKAECVFPSSSFTISCMHGPGFDQHFWASDSSVLLRLFSSRCVFGMG
jgi:hypothetical protein